MPRDTTINALMANVVRIMNNLLQLCESYESKEYVQNFMRFTEIWFSGYDQKDRVRVYKKLVLYARILMVTAIDIQRHKELRIR